ncbi:MAG: stage II sporulation protein M [Candidatus Bathyarchaeota archaeon]|nr:stage II sporulation protein M [Candidatus Bathyarchaeota archaeon]
MQKVEEILNQSFQTAKKMKRLLYLVVLIYFISYMIGYFMITYNMPFALEMSESLLGDIPENPIFKPVLEAIENKNLPFAIIYTFTINLLSGAFLTTTLPGAIPLLGAIISITVSAFRGFMIGALFTYAASLNSEVSAEFGWALLSLGTMILELGAYVFSAAAGINISLSTMFPERYKVKSRWIAFKEAWKDTARIYVIVIIMLVLGAIWEMGGIFIFAP